MLTYENIPTVITHYSTDLNEERRRLYDIYPVQNLLDIAKGRTDAIDEDVYLHSGDRVALRGDQDNKWFSCWGSGSNCEARSCPGTDQPFKCRGEVFWIYAEKRRRGERIRHGDRVALKYSYMRGGMWWVSVHYSGLDSGVVKTKTSPGSSFQNGGPDVNWCCHDEYFIITNNDQPYMNIRDRQVVQLRNIHRPCYLQLYMISVRYNILYSLRCIRNTGPGIQFQLFRRDSPFCVASHN